MADFKSAEQMPPPNNPSAPQASPYPPQASPYPPQASPYPPQASTYPPQYNPYQPPVVNQPPPYNQLPPMGYGTPYSSPAASAPIVITNQQQMMAGPAPAPTVTVIQAPVVPSNDYHCLSVGSLVFAIVTLVCNVSSFCCTVPAIILSAVALGSIDDKQAKTFSFISLGLTAFSYVCLVGLIIWIVSATTASYSSYSSYNSYNSYN